MQTKRARLLWRVAMVALPLAAIAAVWVAADVAAFRSPAQVAEALRALSQRPFGWAWVPLGFAAGTVLFVPVNVLIAGVTLSFNPLTGFAFALVGALVGAAVGYGLGMLFGRGLIDALRGPRVDRVVHSMRKSAFRTSLLLHIVPLGTFSAVNLLAGALRVPFGGFMLGTVLGLLPGLLMMTLLSNFSAVGGWLSVAIVAALGLAVLVQRLMRRGEQPTS